MWRIGSDTQGSGRGLLECVVCVSDSFMRRDLSRSVVLMLRSSHCDTEVSKWCDANYVTNDSQKYRLPDGGQTRDLPGSNPVR